MSRQDVYAMLLREGPLDPAFVRRMAYDPRVADLHDELTPAR